jgi:SAM-dependent methyltransferase
MTERSNSTVAYYDGTPESYLQELLGVDAEPLYRPFLALIPSGGSILDLGCGPGRDTKVFLGRGYQVTAVDASSRMVEAATRLSGQQVQQLAVEELDIESAFDGVWACASLIHVPRRGLADAIRRIRRALRPGGVCYMSFKEGVGERIDATGRHFTDFTPIELEAFLTTEIGLELIKLWSSEDLRLERTQRWANALVRDCSSAAVSS